ncbi:MAG: hypothetical protein LBQ68_00600 [Clostridiales bacterium]|nr:hypothetical protein [Clostridiales bacterium]
MKIINAYWEKRNLGVDTVEFEIDSNDRANVADEIRANEKQYNVVKIPSGNVAVLLAVQKQGYKFAESMLHFSIGVGELKLNSVQQRLNDAVTLAEMDNADIEQLFAEIQNGMFDTDRIYFDPQFTHEQATQRYIGWTRDELSAGTKLFKFVYKEQSIGFIGGNAQKNMSYLGGIYPKFKKSGLGLNVATKNYQINIDYGTKIVNGAVSSNNPSVWKIYFEIGYNLTKIMNILVKHNNHRG